MSTTTGTQQPCAAQALVGTEQEVRHKGRTIKGTVTKWRYGTGLIEKLSAPEDGSRPLAYPSFDILVKPTDGSRAQWLGPFKDGNNGFPSETWLGDVETLNRRDPVRLLVSIRRTLFGHGASEPVYQQKGWQDWVLAAGMAFHDVCELINKHFPAANDTEL